MQLVTLPTETLREPSKKLTKKDVLSVEMQTFFEDLVPAMYTFKGIGLAAPQVGRNIQACVIGKDAISRAFAHEHMGGQPTDLVLVNPTYEKISKKKVTEDEGCLSVPGHVGPTPRHKDIHVKALLMDGTSIAFDAHNFFARVIQHETDHLNGVLYVDKATDLFETRA